MRTSLPLRPLQAEPFSFAATKNGIGRRTSLPLRPLQAKLFFFVAAKIRIGRGPCCRIDRCRRNHSSLSQRKLESDAANRYRYDRSRRNNSLLPQRKLVSDAYLVAATAAAGGTIFLRGIDSQVLARNHESMHPRGLFRGKSCSDSQVYPLKSRITAAVGSFLGKSMR